MMLEELLMMNTELSRRVRYNGVVFVSAELIGVLIWISVKRLHGRRWDSDPYEGRGHERPNHLYRRRHHRRTNRYFRNTH